VKSFKNHLSLVIALVSILFSVQVFIVVERSIDAYKENLAKNYSLVVVSQKQLKQEDVKKKIPLVASLTEIEPDGIIQKLNSGISKKNMELLKVTLPKFYKLKLHYYPSPKELATITKKLSEFRYVTKVETFENTHHNTYKLLLLFKTVVSVFALSVLIVTILLIFKELKIWQFQHNERMSIMGLFGAPVWLRSAVLFRLAIVDAIIASIIAFIGFSTIASDTWIQQQFATMGIEVVVFDTLYDFSVMFTIALGVALLLAFFIVISHKEEV
jgi:cell division transport system permease protein